MKMLRLIILGAVLIEFSSACLVEGQVYNSRRLTRRIAPQPPQAQAQTNSPQAQAPTPAPTAPPQATVSNLPAPPPVIRVVPPVDPVKAKAAKEESMRKALEFQKKRAEEGSESAQYELGMRYLKGDGVEKDEATGRKWLEESSKNGYTPATMKLEALNKPAVASKHEPEQK